MISASTRFFGQPREIIPTRRTESEAATLMDVRETSVSAGLFPRENRSLEHRTHPLVGQNRRERLIQLRELLARDDVLPHFVRAVVMQRPVFERRCAAVR